MGIVMAKERGMHLHRLNKNGIRCDQTIRLRLADISSKVTDVVYSWSVVCDYIHTTFGSFPDTKFLLPFHTT